MATTEEVHPEHMRLLERVLAEVKIEEDGCWEWTGACNRGGYGGLSFAGVWWYVHRLIAVLFLGLDAASGLYVLHTCDRPQCCNPSHLRLGSHADNMADASAKGRLSKKLTPGEVIEIRRLRAEGHTQQDLADRFGVSRMTIRQIERRETWRHLPDEAPDASARSHSTLDSLAESA
jgi:DNA-binding XRE family transcriptional regulator